MSPQSCRRRSGELESAHDRPTRRHTQKERRADPSPAAVAFSLKKEPLSASRAWCGALVVSRVTTLDKAVADERAPSRWPIPLATVGPGVKALFTSTSF